MGQKTYINQSSFNQDLSRCSNILAISKANLEYVSLNQGKMSICDSMRINLEIKDHSIMFTFPLNYRQ